MLHPGHWQHGIGINPSGNAYITGRTFSTGFPTTADASQAALRGTADAFVTRLDPTEFRAVVDDPGRALVGPRVYRDAADGRFVGLAITWRQLSDTQQELQQNREAQLVEQSHQRHRHDDGFGDVDHARPRRPRLLLRGGDARAGGDVLVRRRVDRRDVRPHQATVLLIRPRRRPHRSRA